MKDLRDLKDVGVIARCFSFHSDWDDTECKTSASNTLQDVGPHFANLNPHAPGRRASLAALGAPAPDETFAHR